MENNNNLFSKQDKEVYQKFANLLDGAVEEHYDNIIMNNISDVENQLLIVLKNSELEDVIQSNKKLLGCFLKNEVVCNNNIIAISVVKDFYNFFSKLSNEQKEIVLQHLLIRFEEKQVVKKQVEPNDDFPF